MDPNLRRAEEELELAGRTAGRTVTEQVHSIRRGLVEEDEGESNRAEPGPKVDRIAEVSEKLDGLEAEADGRAREHVERANAYVRAYLKSHPQGG